jgi:hypothetical protein
LLFFIEIQPNWWSVWKALFDDLMEEPKKIVTVFTAFFKNSKRKHKNQDYPTSQACFHI